MKLTDCHKALMSTLWTKSRIAAELDVGNAYYGQLLKKNRRITPRFWAKMQRVMNERGKELLDQPYKSDQERKVYVAQAEYLFYLTRKTHNEKGDESR